MSDITLCTNKKCHMKDICLRAIKKPSVGQLRLEFIPFGEECEGLWIAPNTKYNEDEIFAIRNQLGRFDVKTPSLF